MFHVFFNYRKLQRMTSLKFIMQMLLIYDKLLLKHKY